MQIAVKYHRNNEVESVSLNVSDIACEMSLDHKLSKHDAIARVFTNVTGLPKQCIFDVDDMLPAPTGDFVVNEYMSGFELEHIASGETHWLSDGVDVLSYEYNDDEVTLSPGVFGFAELWTETLNQDSNITYEAYFPSLNDE